MPGIMLGTEGTGTLSQGPCPPGAETQVRDRQAAAWTEACEHLDCRGAAPSSDSSAGFEGYFSSESGGLPLPQTPFPSSLWAETFSSPPCLPLRHQDSNCHFGCLHSGLSPSTCTSFPSVCERFVLQVETARSDSRIQHQVWNLAQSRVLININEGAGPRWSLLESSTHHRQTKRAGRFRSASL